MWRGEGGERERRVDIGTAGCVQLRAGNTDEVAAIVDDFIEAMSEDYEEFDEEEEEEDEDEEVEDDGEDEEYEDEDEFEEVDPADSEDESIRQNGNRTPH